MRNSSCLFVNIPGFKTGFQDSNFIQHLHDLWKINIQILININFHYRIKGILNGHIIPFKIVYRYNLPLRIYDPIFSHSIILIIVKLLGGSDTAMVLTLFAFATPLGLNTVVFPAAYGGETKTGASMAMISHLLCIITIPLMYTVFSMLFGL